MEKIVFTNQPKLSSREADSSRNEKKLELTEKIKDFLASHGRFKDKDVKVDFATDGVASLVSIITTPEERVVLKIPLNVEHSGEAQFLKAWGSSGVSVPHVIEEGYIEKDPYILMNYINSPTLLQKAGSREKILEDKYYIEIGRTLRQMHQPKTKGYGNIINSMPAYSTFREWLDSAGTQNRIRRVKEASLIDIEEGNIDKVMEFLRAKIGEETESSYCHNDLDPGNIFATNPLTIFDPSPVLNHPYIDLGVTITIGASLMEGEEVYRQIVEGYFPDKKELDEELLRATTILTSYIKFDRWHKIKNEKRITRMKGYLKRLTQV